MQIGDKTERAKTNEEKGRCVKRFFRWQGTRESTKGVRGYFEKRSQVIDQFGKQGGSYVTHKRQGGDRGVGLEKNVKRRTWGGDLQEYKQKS